MTPVVINLPDIVEGDTWEGVKIGPILFNGLQPTSALKSCQLGFSHTRDLSKIFLLKSINEAGCGTITVIDATTWEIEVPSQPLNMGAGDWAWSYKTTDMLDVTRTLYMGILKVIHA